MAVWIRDEDNGKAARIKSFMITAANFAVRERKPQQKSF
jgi:hypothetical protein